MIINSQHLNFQLQWLEAISLNTISMNPKKGTVIITHYHEL